jgi:septum formation protein
VIRSLILASSSPYRKELLSRLGLPFSAVSPDIDETPLPDEPPAHLVERLAAAKARAIADQHAHSLVIGSDQIAVHQGAIVGKPGNHDRAVAQLRAASGQGVTLYTGLALVDADSGRTQSEVIPFRVVFRKLNDDQIERYLRKEQPYNCAGSVKSEGLGIALLERFEGEDPNTLIGLPLIRLVAMLEKEGVEVV